MPSGSAARRHRRGKLDQRHDVPRHGQALTPRERRIIALRYLNGKTQTQVAKEIGISQAQVSRLEKAALNHIKEQICNN